MISIGVLCATAALAQDFEAWEGKPVIHEGQGGTKEVVDAVMPVSSNTDTVAYHTNVRRHQHFGIVDSHRRSVL
jgi:hypothetical protein